MLLIWYILSDSLATLPLSIIDFPLSVNKILKN